MGPILSPSVDISTLGAWESRGFGNTASSVYVVFLATPAAYIDFGFDVDLFNQVPSFSHCVLILFLKDFAALLEKQVSGSVVFPKASG